MIKIPRIRRLGIKRMTTKDYIKSMDKKSRRKLVLLARFVGSTPEEYMEYTLYRISHGHNIKNQRRLLNEQIHRDLLNCSETLRF